MSILYSIKEAISGFSKARISTVITIFSSFFLISILAIFAILSTNVYRIANILNANYDMQLYLSNILSDVEIQTLLNELKENPDIKDVNYISKQQAAAEFMKAFGEDVFDALEENPLPSSFVVSLYENSESKRDANAFAAHLQERPEIDEVVLHQQSLDTLLKFSKISRIVLYALFVLVFTGSFFMISNTIRLIILARRPLIDTMQLVGATNSFIQRPFIIQGILQGFLGGAGAALLIYIAMKIIALQWPGLILISSNFYLLLMFAGIFFGFAGSLFAVKRFL